MPNNPWYDFLIGAGIVSQGIALAAVLRSGSASRWKALIISLAVAIVVDCALGLPAVRENHYQIYFYGVWGGQAVASLLRLWLLIQVAKSFEGLDFFPPSLITLICGLTAFLAAAGGLYGYYAKPSLDSALSGIVLLDRSVTFAWVVATGVLLAITRLLNFAWTQIGARVTIAIVIQISSEATSAFFRAMSHSFYDQAYALDSLIHISAFTFLAWCFLDHGKKRSQQGPLSLPHAYGRES